MVIPKYPRTGSDAEQKQPLELARCGAVGVLPCDPERKGGIAAAIAIEPVRTTLEADCETEFGPSCHCLQRPLLPRRVHFSLSWEHGRF